jgi:hypothetical protein
MNLDDALLWLNDRLGGNVAVEIVVYRGDMEVAVLRAQGELRHWSAAQGAGRAVSREDVAGLYDVGGAALDLTDVRPLEVTTGPDDQLTVRLDEHTTLVIVEQDDARA